MDCHIRKDKKRFLTISDGGDMAVAVAVAVEVLNFERF